MLKYGRIHCAACRGVRRLSFAPLLEGVMALGAVAACATCRHVAFTLVRGGESFCPVCDTLEPLEIVPSSVPGAGFACCSRCGQLLAALYADVSPRVS